MKKGWILISVAVILLIAFLQFRKPGAEPSAYQPHIPAETVSRALNSVIEIHNRATGASGSGYFVWKHDSEKFYFVLTCSHVITASRYVDPDVSRLQARHAPFADSSVVSFDCAFHDPQRDIAILITTPIHADLPVLGLADTFGYRPLQAASPPLLIAGFPGGRHTLIPTTTVERSHSRLWENHHWSLSDSAGPGSSGSPVVTYDGVAVAMVQAGDRTGNRTVCLGLPGIMGFFYDVANGRYRAHHANPR